MDIRVALAALGAKLDSQGTKVHPLAHCMPAPDCVRGIGGVLTRQHRKIGRNEQCPCNSRLKFKHCCGAHPDVRRKVQEEETLHTEAESQG